MPLMYVAATKPPRSPTTPPPSASRQVSRPHERESIKSSICALLERVLLDSPGGRMKWWTGMEAEAKAARRGAP